MDNIELSHATLDDIVFENRNKSYGAFFLRKLYDKNVLIALGIAISAFSLALAAPVIVKLFSSEEVAVVEDKIVDVKIVDVPLDPKAPKPLPLPKIDPPQIKTLKFIPPKPAPDEEVNEPPPPLDTEKDKTKISDVTKDGEDTEADVPDVPVGDPNGLVDNGDEIYSGTVEKNPEFPGGWGNYIRNNFRQKVRFFVEQNDIKGIVLVYFVVSSDGSVSVRILRGIANCPPCNEEAKRLLESSPKWIPAEANGHPVKIPYTQKISF